MSKDESVEQETAALEVLLKALEPFEPETQERLVETVRIFLGLGRRE